MKINKNKIVFVSVLAVVIIFIVAYSLMVFTVSEEGIKQKITEPSVPALGQQEKKYNSKLDAINDLKEVRQNNAPSIYDEKILDSLSLETDLSQELQENLDSLYQRQANVYEQIKNEPEYLVDKVEEKINQIADEVLPDNKQITLKHQIFFASATSLELTKKDEDFNSFPVEIDGDQVVQANSRLKLSFTQDVIISGQSFAKNTPVYGLVSFQPNRVLIAINHIEQYAVRLKAFDLQDGGEGIYMENNFRADASREVVDDIIQDINIPSVPQLGGITKVLQRNNRKIKVTILNNYKLILKNE